MAAESHGFDLIPTVALLGAAVVAVPIFKRLGLGSVLGYLAAGLVIGPFGIGLFTDPGSILQVAELGVVMLLFIIGLEMKPSRLWSLRREIFGLGVAQVLVCAALLTGVGILGGFSPAMAFVAGAGFVLTSTAVVLQVLEERGETNEPAGQKIVSILLLEDLAIVPLLAIVAFLAPIPEEADSRLAPDRDRHRRRRGRRRLSRRPLPAQSAVPHPRRRPCPRDHDGGGPARRARRGAGHPARRPVDGDGRLPRRRGPLRIDLPPRARSRRRAVPRHPPRPVLPQRRHVAQPVGDRHRLAADPRRRRRLHGGEGHRHLPASRGPSSRTIRRRSAALS